ncbi:3'-5' exonuclease [Leptolyngbya sp. CCNP1308]|uniref:3'-5' exonuclease n=1 Tax=Leptolyngbya sp. CCNP1308 TaxID=3110255 RepID=UPI002B1F5A58|nr:3'-5' exonuclease [Leptolyngbya sp. CCNP1308]MEA5452720.1 3'-5' exonuclease [Leptolyngbya sp. CCNP1308]
MVPVSVGGIAQSALFTDQLLAYYRQLSDGLLTVVDVETTGSRPPEARVIEIAVVQGSLDQGITHEASFLVNAQVRVPHTITRLTGITTAMVEQGTAADTVWQALRSPLDQGVLTGHNLAFDYSFIQAEYQRLGLGFKRPEAQQFCTVILSRLLLADLPSRSLPQLVRHFGFDVGRSHRALADTKACWLLSNLLLERLANTSDDALRQQFAEQWVPLRDAVKVFGCPRADLQRQLDARGCDRRTSRRGNRHMYRRGDLETLYRELYPEQLSLNLSEGSG